MAELNNYLDDIKIPTHDNQVYKDESVYDFDTPESENGLFICLKTFYGVSKRFLELHHSKTKSKVYLNIKRKKIEEKDASIDEKPSKITKLAIGVEGGFQPDKISEKYNEELKIILYPELKEFNLIDIDIPETIRISVDSVIACESAFLKEELKPGTWDGDKLKITKYADLEQLNNGIKIPPKNWICKECDKRDNLWLNLTDGSVLCGRKNYDGSGGNNHAFEHYMNTRYPLAVKLGTITSEGKGDVYSYPEDDMVENPNLIKHLSHFGINVSQMEKTDKTMLELEIDANRKLDEWLTIQESNSNLTLLYGAGYVGLSNLGNSCYLNSVMQTLFSFEEFRNTYLPIQEKIYKETVNPNQDLDFQMAKLAFGLYSPYYSIKPANDQPVEQKGIKPTSFKSLVGKNHPEFSTKRQQDVQEFFAHVLDLIEKNLKSSKKIEFNPTDLFRFKLEDKTQCQTSKKVGFVERTECVLSLPIPVDKASNLNEVDQYLKEKEQAEKDKITLPTIVRPKIKLEDCLNQFASEEIIEDWISPETKQKTQAKKSLKIKTYPDYLVLHMKKFTLDDSWQPKKIDCSLEVPDQLDLAYLRGTGLQVNEELLPDYDLEPEINFDENVITQLVEMGFTKDASKRALLRTKSNDLETGLNWLFEHRSDDDFNAPIEIDLQKTKKTSSKSKDKFIPNPEGISMLMAMGISESHAKIGLKNTNNNVEAAVEWIFSNDLSALNNESNVLDEEEVKFKDGSEKYKLVAFISHMGTSAQCGHYVCHINKDGKWVIYNDNKVALSENPPRDLAYMYFYKRI